MDLAMRLSEHFTVGELVRSQLATRRGIDNTPPDVVLQNLQRLCVDLLEPVRATLGRSMHVNSGYRCPALNMAVGGAPNSAHVLGCAADVDVDGMTPLAVCQALQKVQWPNLDQCIYEGTWTHLAVTRPGHLFAPRRQYLTASFQHGVASYSGGIPA